MRERESARVRARFSTAKDSGARRRLPGFGKGFLEQATTFFFYDFPEDRSAKDLWFCFWSYGKVVDVYIPTRRDRRGRRFGFVRMSGAFDVKDMERRLNQIWLDYYRLKVKLAENMKKGRDEIRAAQNGRDKKQWVRRDMMVRPGRSYAQAVAANLGAIAEGLSSTREREETADAVALKGASMKASAVVPGKKPETISGPMISEGVDGATSPLHRDLVLEFAPRDEEVAWLHRSMVAVVRSLDMVRQIQNRMDVDGLMVNVALLGGRQIILVNNSGGCLAEFIEKNKELTELWFEWVQPTSLSTVSSASRLAWLRFSGVPLQSWSERCFAELGGLFGEVVLVDEDTKSKSFLCEGRVLILCETRGKVTATIILKVGGEAYPIEVVEEEWRMDPDWWLAGERWNPIAETNSEYSRDDGSESGLMATGFCGENEAGNDDLQVVTGKESVEYFENFEINEMEIHGLDIVGPEGEDILGPEGVDMAGLAAMTSVEQRAAGGSISGLIQQHGEKNKKKSRALGAIYAEDEGIGDLVDGREKLKAGEANWVTARTKSRRDRRSKASREESRPEMQTVSCSLSDGCIQNRNRVIRQQIQLDEVQRLFMLGQRLGVKCNQNEEEVMSRLVMLEEGEEANYKVT
ncbi:hypothetical protein SLE2022_163510 [Rubroshorea leprosula]